MKNLVSLRLIVIMLIAVLPFTGALCPGDPTGPEEEKCGSEVQWSNSLNFDAYSRYTVEGGRAIFQYEDTDIPRDICVNSHLSVAYTIFTYIQRLPDTWAIKGNSYWQGNHREIQISSGDFLNQYKGGESFSIKDAFGTNAKGWLALQVFISFPTNGSLAEDKKTLEVNIFSITLQCAYLKYIEK